MKIIRSIKKMQALSMKFAKSGDTVALVPTMGALHKGHISLVDRARRENKIVIVSIFVNQKQFGPKEDYQRYPRPFEQDSKVCKSAGVDFLFVPDPEDMYPEGYRTFVEVEKMSGVLCGAFRPGHFRGVATVVLKLFNITMPQKAYFGLKDYQQVKVIQRMVADLNLPVKIIPCSIIRELSGLAMSSRNVYLSHSEHKESAGLFETLQLSREMIKSRKVKTNAELKRVIVGRISKMPGASIDYVEIVDPETLEPLTNLIHPALIAVAVWMKKTRLIDNILTDKC